MAEQEQIHEHIKTLSKTCSCMDELVRDMLFTAVKEASYTAQTEIRRSRDTLGLLGLAKSEGRIIPTDPTEEEINQRIIEDMASYDNYRVLEEQLKKLELCPRAGSPESITQGLVASAREENIASTNYRARAREARSKSDQKTSELYEHVGLEEAVHYDKIKERLEEKGRQEVV
ncbi:MAG TPA: hypothetical protein VMV84_01225 [Dehalococcoidales bacterium]|nr:hypothetical protein [Dehalococcoidales bacterium]